MTRTVAVVFPHIPDNTDIPVDIASHFVSAILALHSLGPSYNGDVWRCVTCGCPEAQFPCSTRQLVIDFLALVGGSFGEERIDEEMIQPEVGPFPLVRFNTKLVDQMYPDPRER